MIVLLFAVFFICYSIIAKLKPVEHDLVQQGDIVTITRSAKRQWALAYAIWVPGVLMVIAGVSFKVPYLPSEPLQVMLLGLVTLFMGAFLAYMPMILSPVIVVNGKLKTVQLNKTTLAFNDLQGLRYYDARARITTARNGYVLCLILATGKERKLIGTRNEGEAKLLNKIFYQLLKLPTQAILPNGLAKTKTVEVDYVK